MSARCSVCGVVLRVTRAPDKPTTCAAHRSGCGMPFQGDPCPACRWPLGGWVKGDVYRCHHCHSDVDIVTGEVWTDQLPMLGGG